MRISVCSSDVCSSDLDASGIGRVWIGTILLAGATSLPELATDVAAVKIGAADLAAGDLFGSSMANMLIFALVGLFIGKLTQTGRRAEHVAMRSEERRVGKGCIRKWKSRGEAEH